MKTLFSFHVFLSATFAALTAIFSSALSGERKRGTMRLKLAAIWEMPVYF